MSAPSYWFMVGHEPLLSLAELTALFPAATFARVTPTLFQAELDLPRGLMNRLGGTVKIAQEIGDALTEEALFAAIEHELATVSGKIHFGLSTYPSAHGALEVKRLATWGLTIKKQMKAGGNSVRYVDNRGFPALSSAVVLHNGLAERGREFIIVPTASRKYRLARTIAVQPLEAFSERDFGRPGRDDVSGMLPPKLAMMMINCAGIARDRALYDPSCGSGTILTEAMLMGYTKLIGSDVSGKAIDDTKQNSAWIKQNHPQLDATITVFEHDITKPAKEASLHDSGGIVSEPYMGPPLKGRETPAELERNAHEIASLYIKSFTSFATFLKKGASVVYIFPRFSPTIRTSLLVLPEIKKLGFKVVPLLPAELSKEPFVLYQRDNQRVGREIWKFVF